jgi:hypothetical protein
MNILNVLVVPKKWAFIIKSIPNIVKENNYYCEDTFKTFLKVQMIWQ